MNNKLIKTALFFGIPSFCILQLNNKNKIEEEINETSLFEKDKIPIKGLCDSLFSSKK